MSLDGLRAWIGEVERKLGMRTRVFIVLVAIAVGGAGAAIYLAIEAKSDAVSKSELQAVRDEAASAAGVPSEGGGSAQLEAEISALQEEVAALRAEGDGSAGGKSDSPESSTGGVTPGSASGGAAVPKNQKQLQELVEKTEGEAEKK
jgi:hypothetical protein